MNIERAGRLQSQNGTIGITRRKDMRRAGLGGLALLLAFATLASACGSVSQPQGWAPPVEAKGTVYVSIKAGKLAALNSNLTPETGTQCDNSTDDDGDGSINEGCPQAGQKSE